MPPTTFAPAIPILFVRNVLATAAWFRDKLGFAIDFLHGTPPFYGAVSRGEARLHLRFVHESALTLLPCEAGACDERHRSERGGKAAKPTEGARRDQPRRREGAADGEAASPETGKTWFQILAAREPSLILATIEVPDVHALFAELKTRGATIAQPPTKQDWGGTDLHVTDPDGNALAFVTYA